MLHLSEKSAAFKSPNKMCLNRLQLLSFICGHAFKRQPSELIDTYRVAQAKQVMNITFLITLFHVVFSA